MADASKQIEMYFDELIKKTNIAYSVASEARKKGYDPEKTVDISLAKNMAERVEGLISAVAPQLVGKGVIKRIEELEKEYGRLSWQVALRIALEVAQQKFCKFKDEKEAMEVGIRTGFAYHTVGIVSAPLEGLVEIKIKKRRDGKDYLAVVYAGPIRGAGGTACAVSLLIADFVRKNFGIAEYDPDENEIKRYSTELTDYHERVTNLQYNPSDEEKLFLAKNIPIEISGEPTEKIEVSNFKNLPRVETDKIRGGVCLVLSMLALKAPKLWNELNKWGKEFGMEQWNFLEEFIKIQKAKKAKSELKKEESKQKITPDYTYIADLVAGRPVLSYPLADGGLRLRYGRCRTSGYSAASIHPATMIILKGYIAIGTQVKVERPSKGAALSSCDTIEGPIVKLTNGNVIRIETEEEAKRYKNEIEEILFLGDILFSYGDFADRSHILIPPGYCEEWWVKELEKGTVDLFGAIDYEKLAELIEISAEKVEELMKNPYKISSTLAIKISKLIKVPLHPRYTYHWRALKSDEILSLVEWLDSSKVEKSDVIEKIILPLKKEKRYLEIIGLPHIVSADCVVIEKEDAGPLLASLGIEKSTDVEKVKEKIQQLKDKTALEIINEISTVRIRDKSGTFIGARMGRPEKAKMRKMTGSPHSLFPCGEEGGRLRAFQSALEKGYVEADFPDYLCKKCKNPTILPVCEICGNATTKIFSCKICGKTEKLCAHNPKTFSKKKIDIVKYFNSAIEKINESQYPDLIKGVRGTSNKEHIPEPLAKGILRAKHNIYVNKDGTTRYDMTELPLTHFKPKEIGTTVQKLRQLGYEKDIYGNELVNEEQLLEIKPQDVVLPASSESPDEKADDVLFRIANFIDDLLVKFYGLESFYNLKTKEDLIGHLVIGLAPHISAGIIGRIIGFSETQGCFAHPLWHAAHRRDCDGDENCIMLLMDALLNFSRQYLPDKRGGRTMDAPLVLTVVLNPSEVDDMVHKVDVPFSYPLEFYEACLQYKHPRDVKIDQIGKRLGTELQYESMGFTHNTKDISAGVRCSAYKILPTMEEKLKGQMELAEKIRAVDKEDVARLVIEKHLLRDIRGNLRKFSNQRFRCVKCNENFRRPPLSGKCSNCGGNIIFTISEGSIVKYLQPSLSIARKYAVSSYLKQVLELTRRMVESTFGKEKEKQTGLGSWFG